jgi:N-glycosidase YbiA
MPTKAREPIPDVIPFSSTRGEYGYLANFYPAPISLGGKIWPTSEHYFQGRKFTGTPDEGAIRLTPSPMVAARMGRSRQRPLRADWEMVKERVMLEALRAKFTQHPDLRAALLATGDARLVEHTARDAFWGDGGDGHGRNRLGALMEQIRDELRAQDETRR